MLRWSLQGQTLRLHTRTKRITKQIQAMTEKQKGALAEKVLAKCKGKKVTPLELRKMVLNQLEMEKKLEAKDFGTMTDEEVMEVLTNGKVVYRRQMN